MAPQPKIQTENTYDVFQPGLIRGSARSPHSPKKKYFYVEHPQEGWRVYLRGICFLHELFRPFSAKRFLVVKRTGADPDKASWEPPKGQMEGKDGGESGSGSSGGQSKPPVFNLLKNTIRREVEEEAKVKRVRELQHTGLVLQSTEPDFPPNTFFQYHVFHAYVHPNQLESAFREFAWIEEHPEEFKKVASDKREKDGLAWYDGNLKKMMGRWSPTLVDLYVKKFS